MELEQSHLFVVLKVDSRIRFGKFWELRNYCIELFISFCEEIYSLPPQFRYQFVSFFLIEVLFSNSDTAKASTKLASLTVVKLQSHGFALLLYTHQKIKQLLRLGTSKVVLEYGM